MAELDEDRWYVVQRWLNMIPEELKPVRPELLLSDAWSAYENFQLEQIPGLLDQVKALLKDNEEQQALLGECYLIYGLVYHWSGNGDMALEQFQKALKFLPDKRKLAMGMLYLHIALARGATGKKELAFKDLDKQFLDGRGNAIYLTRLACRLLLCKCIFWRFTSSQKRNPAVTKTGLRGKPAIHPCNEHCHGRHLMLSCLRT